MICDSCGNEERWLEVVGSNFICHKCINKHKIMGFLLRTHVDTFQFVLRKLKIRDYTHMMSLTKKDVSEIIETKKTGIKLP